MSEGTLLRLAGRVRESIVDGPGLRYTLFAQGCPHRCPSCQNPHTWPLEGGEEIDIDTLRKEILSDSLLRGVTLSGGEPFLQAGVLSLLAQEVQAAGLDVWLYSGYTWEEILASGDPDWLALLRHTDVLVDGRFVWKQKTYGLRFRGSANQRLIDVKLSLEEGELILWE